ncbi:MAG: ribonuclease R [Pseudomonadota bacterium]
MPKNSPAPRPPLSRELVLDAIKKGASAKADLARVLGVRGEERVALRAILKDLEEEGKLGRVGKRAFASAEQLSSGGVMEVIDRDTDGELLARMRGKDGLFGPTVRVAPGEAAGKRGEPALGVGDRFIAKIERDREGQFARVVKRLGQSAHVILGVYIANQYGGRVEPADRKARHDLIIDKHQSGGAKDGDLVMVELAGQQRPHGPKRGIVKEVIGRADDPRAASILAMHTHGVPMGFSPEEEAQAAAAQKPTLKGREDLRAIPLVTIDPEDARDHDDAVYAVADDNEKNKGGWRVWVAIADVAAYVTPGSALDRGALKRGNSTYFPDRVAPMLPESLSADLCSLREKEDRACLAVEMIFDSRGKKLRHRFVRGLMRSAAKLSYGQAQAAIDGKPDDATGPLLDPVLKPLWAAYATMKIGREGRAPLDLDTPEHRIVFGPDGRVAGVKRRERFDAHKLIEEMMIQANVAAAETLEAKKTPLVYRVHDKPSDMKIAALTDFLPTIGMSWSKGQSVTPARFNHLLKLGAASEHRDVINEVVLRTQAQAIYSPENIGHFGLNLSHYAHFTSPIRRYADLIVHRALIRALGFGKDGLTDAEMGKLEEIAEHISQTERRSMAAEREATERYIAGFLADRVGAEFEGRITGVTRFGAFVKLTETNADGLAPISRLPERFMHEEKEHALVSVQSGARYQLGQKVIVRLEEATPISGGLLFEILSPPLKAQAGWRKPRGGAPSEQRPFRRRRR